VLSTRNNPSLPSVSAVSASRYASRTAAAKSPRTTGAVPWPTCSPARASCALTSMAPDTLVTSRHSARTTPSLFATFSASSIDRQPSPPSSAGTTTSSASSCPRTAPNQGAKRWSGRGAHAVSCAAAVAAHANTITSDNAAPPRAYMR
jgi:hypothetical protein